MYGLLKLEFAWRNIMISLNERNVADNYIVYSTAEQYCMSDGSV